MARGVFFDLFGTLLVYGDMKRAWSDWLDAFHAALLAHGLALRRAEFAKRCDLFFGQEEPAPDGKASTVFERRILGLCGGLGLDIEGTEASRIADRIAGVWQERVELDPDARGVLRALRERHRLALVTNFDHPPHVRRVLEAHRLAEFFPTVVVSGEVGVKKPDPRIFEPALRQTGLRPDEVVYVGDTDEDVAAARAAGMRPVLIRRPEGATGADALDFTAGGVGTAPRGGPEPGRGVAVVASLRELPGLLGGSDSARSRTEHA